MRSSSTLFLIATGLANADLLRTLNHTVGRCSYTATCIAGGISGVCVDTSAGCCEGSTTSLLCPGTNDIKCCTRNPCSTPQGSGTCVQTSACSGTSVSGYCVGPASLQCCVDSSPTPGPSPGPSPGPATSHLGVDVSDPVTQGTFSCMKNNGISFVVSRAFHSTGNVDTAACGTLRNAMNAGIDTRDVYMFPCPTCTKSASEQVSEMVSYLKGSCPLVWSGRVWLDIEGSQYWHSSTATNKEFYEQLSSACKSSSASSCGVYSSAVQWSELFGSLSYAPTPLLPLWYAHYDNAQTFSDFSSFGGWTSPHAKQYQGDTTLCSTGLDKNWSPSF